MVEEGHSTNLVTDVTTDVSTEVVHALLAAGADVKALDKWGDTALIIAATLAKIEVARADTKARDKDDTNALIKATAYIYTEAAGGTSEAGTMATLSSSSS